MIHLLSGPCLKTFWQVVAESLDRARSEINPVFPLISLVGLLTRMHAPLLC